MMNTVSSLQNVLPARLWRELQRLAQKYAAFGLELFIFGSFARGDQRPNSDLDLGVEWQGERAPAIFRQLYDEVESLPTIRPIDLVDFTQVGLDFKRVAGTHKIYLVDKANS